MSPAYVWPSITGLTTPDQRTYTLCGRCGADLREPSTDPERRCRDCDRLAHAEAQERAVRDLVDEGHSTQHIARTLRMSSRTVRTIRNQLGIPARPGPAPRRRTP